jgi:hypothetical protein
MGKLHSIFQEAARDVGDEVGQGEARPSLVVDAASQVPLRPKKPGAGNALAIKGRRVLK